MMPRAAILSPLWRPWRFATGLALGAATSVKWSGAMAIATAVLLCYLWETSRRHRPGIGWGTSFLRAFARETFGLVLAFVVLPLAVFVAIWLPWIHHFGWDWGRWWDTQVGSFDYHFKGGLEWTKIDPDTGSATPTHPYYARPWEWIIPPGRPTSFFVKDLGPDIQQILALGSPAVFWAYLFALPYVLFSWWRARDWKAGFLAVTFLGLYLPWLGVSRPTFYFYAVPLVPFMVLGVTYALRDAADARLVVRDRETGDVAVNPETGSARDLEQLRLSAVRLGLPDRGRRDVRAVLAADERRADDRHPLARDRLVQSLDLRQGVVERPRKHGSPARSRGRSCWDIPRP